MAFTDYDKCSLLLPMDGANNGTTFTDWSPNPKTVTVAGNAKTVTAQSKYYGSSGYFDGSGDYLAVPNSSAFQFGAGDFTLAVWAYGTSFSENKVILNLRGNPTTSNIAYVMFIDQLSKLSMTFSYDGTTNNTIASVSSVGGSQWVHLAIQRRGSSLELYINGVKDANTHSIGANTIFNSTNTLSIGANHDGSRCWNGYIQDLLIIKGAALWTSDFTPPTRLIGEISGNVKDINGDNASRIIHAIPRSNPTRIFSTTSDGGTGNYTLPVPATEVSRIVLANEIDLYNDKIDRIIPE